MSAAHTPGPWKHGHLGFALWVGPDYDQTPVAVVEHDTESARDNSRANAALIARAPDLLAENERLREALRRVAARTRDYDTLSMIDLALDPKQTALARARAALSEQEGEPAKDVGREGAFRAGYKAGFDAAKHPFHMPVADEAFAFFSEQEGK